MSPELGGVDGVGDLRDVAKREGGQNLRLEQDNTTQHNRGEEAGEMVERQRLVPVVAREPTGPSRNRYCVPQLSNYQRQLQPLPSVRASIIIP